MLLRCSAALLLFSGLVFAAPPVPDAGKAGLDAAQMQKMRADGVDFSNARLAGDLSGASLRGAIFDKADLSADMKNQSMGLMRANIVSAKAIEADLSDSDFSRTDFSFSDLSRAKMLRTKLFRADFSGANLSRADLSGADLRDAVFNDTDLSGANLTNADLTGATARNVHGLDTATTTGARGLPKNE